MALVNDSTRILEASVKSSPMIFLTLVVLPVPGPARRTLIGFNGGLYEIKVWNHID